MNKWFHAYSGFLRCLLIVSICPVLCFAKNPENDPWQKHELLTNRLSTEWYKINILRKDLENIQDILTALRDFQLYPAQVTRLNEDSLVALDRAIEKAEKEHRGLVDELNKIRSLLSDAIGILREMAAGQPVEDMFILIEQGDLERISHLFTIKHRIDKLWLTEEKLVQRTNDAMYLDPVLKDTASGLEDDFFKIIQAYLGQQAEGYYGTLNQMKLGLIKRSHDSLINKMYKIDLFQIKKNLGLGADDIIKRKLLQMKDRYAGRMVIHELNLLLAQVYFALGDFKSVLLTTDLIPNDPQLLSDKILYMVQSWYASEQFDKIWNWSQTISFSNLDIKNKNIILWMVMESGLALHKQTDYSQYAEQINKQEPYGFHMLHALARTYLELKQPEVALSIIKKALKTQPVFEIDKTAYDKIILLHAQELFDNGDYQNALDQFFVLLNKSDYYEEGIFGMVWCYIKMGLYQKAETSLRKLINQSPESPRSAEAFLLMAKRFTNKALYEWKKTAYYGNEEHRIQLLIQQLEENFSSTSDRAAIQKYTSAKNQYLSIFNKLKSEKREDFAAIAAYFKQGLSICKLVDEHYETGTFQTVVFSKKRERILHTLDSLTSVLKNEKINTFVSKAMTREQQNNIETIKMIVRENFILSTEIQLQYYRWEKEYVNWQKMLLSEQKIYLTAKTGAVKDSALLDTLARNKNTISRRIDSLVLEDNELQQYWYEKLSQLLTQVVLLPLDSSDEMYFRYQLGELHYKEENRMYAAAFEQFERDHKAFDSLLNLFHKGSMAEMPIEPKPPRLNHDQSIRDFRAVTEAYPNNPFTAAPRYSLAWCYNDIGQLDSALHQMTLITSAYPECPFTAQAWMFLGEYYFERSSLEKAIAAYKTVLRYPESDYFDDALYKLAWTHYRLSNPEKAISSFLALVDLGKIDKSGKALLETESMDYIAISFSESDVTGEKGLERAIMFCKKLNDPEKGTKIVHRLAQVYEEQGRFELAKKTYTTILQMFPAYKMNPGIEAKLVKLMERELTTEQVNVHKLDFFKKYNYSSLWARQQKDTSVIRKADSIACVLLYDASITYHQLALQKSDTVMYGYAMDAYKNFIHYYPKSPVANECHYNLAEILFSIGKYGEAAQEYIAVSKRYPDSKYKETAAWNAIVASQNLLKQEQRNR